MQKYSNMYRAVYISILVILSAICCQEQSNTINDTSILIELDPADHLMIVRSKNRIDTVSIPTKWQSDSYNLLSKNDHEIVVELLNGTQISYDRISPQWHIVGMRKYAATIDDGIYYGASKPRENPFSNKVLIPIYFILGSSLIYGLIRIILLKNEYDIKLNVEKLERSKLEEINQVKVNFYNMISHELKTPLTLIIGPIQELRQEVNNDKHIILLDYAEKNANKLKSLIDELLDYKNHEFEYFDLNLRLNSLSDFVQEICLNFRDNADRKGVLIDLNIDLDQEYVYFDSRLMELVLNNLIVNALRFAPMDSNIEISVWDDKKGPHFSISDEGPGILEKDLPHIFKKYYQGNIGPKKGNGIGLALAKEIIIKHHGKIDVAVKGNRTTFSFSYNPNLGEVLPHYSDDNSLVLEQIENLKKNTISNQDKSILIIDDNDDIRTYLNFHLHASFNIIQARNGEEGYSIAQTQVPDLIISDIAMPKMDGITMCSMIKSNPITNHIPIILLTARKRDKYYQRSLIHGADAYLMKPFDIHMLQQKVNNILTQIDRIQKKMQSQISIQQDDNTVATYNNEFIDRFIQVVKENFSDPKFSVEFIAKALNLSTSQCYRKIKSLTGSTPNQIIKSIKLEQAYRLIIETDMSISNIIIKLGMSDPKYFRKIFKEKYNQTPSEVRKSSKYNPD